MNFQTSSLWNLELLVRGQAKQLGTEIRHSEDRMMTRGNSESANYGHPQAKRRQCLCMVSDAAKVFPQYEPHQTKDSFTSSNVKKDHIKVGLGTN